MGSGGSGTVSRRMLSTRTVVTDHLSHSVVDVRPDPVASTESYQRFPSQKRGHLLVHMLAERSKKTQFAAMRASACALDGHRDSSRPIYNRGCHACSVDTELGHQCLKGSATCASCNSSRPGGPACFSKLHRLLRWVQKLLLMPQTYPSIILLQAEARQRPLTEL